MAKHPVPKKKTSRARTSRRYKNFQNRARIRLTNSAQLTKCPSCAAVVLQHRACTECGNYRGRDVNQSAVPKAVEAAKVTTIKAD
ncbi:MAG: large subunit ribosomal protein L32 [Oceanicoccus sp.]|jgi:large subunit ribosomal protein L32